MTIQTLIQPLISISFVLFRFQAFAAPSSFSLEVISKNTCKERFPLLRDCQRQASIEITKEQTSFILPTRTSFKSVVNNCLSSYSAKLMIEANSTQILNLFSSQPLLVDTTENERLQLTLQTNKFFAENPDCLISVTITPKLIIFNQKEIASAFVSSIKNIQNKVIMLNYLGLFTNTSSHEQSLGELKDLLSNEQDFSLLISSTKSILNDLRHSQASATKELADRIEDILVYLEFQKSGRSKAELVAEKLASIKIDSTPVEILKSEVQRNRLEMIEDCSAAMATIDLLSEDQVTALGEKLEQLKGLCHDRVR